MAKFTILQSFYASPKWITFRRGLIMERMDDMGRVICEHCKKHITVSKDIQAHHTIELTPENVRDYSISMNPQLIELICLDCHNQEHGRFGHSTSIDRKVYLVYGPPMSGKHLYVKERLKEGDIVIDIDLLYTALTMQPLYNKPVNLLKNIWDVQSLLIDHIKTRHGDWKNAWIIGGYADKYKRNRLVEGLGAEEIYMDVSREECIRRLTCEATLVNVKADWIKYIDKWFDSFTR